MADSLVHPLLTLMDVPHGFGLIDSVHPQDLVRPRQVHGKVVATLRADGRLSEQEADAVVSSRPAPAIGIITADCVPLLVAGPKGASVSAIHAGWRGLAAGVVERGISALCELSGAQASSLVAVIGPHIGDCCYEVDAPVLTELQRRFGDAVGLATRPTRVGHHRLSLAELVIRELELCGVAKGSIGRLESACTRCDPVRFHSHRRDGERAGRLVHHISAREIA